MTVRAASWATICIVVRLKEASSRSVGAGLYALTDGALIITVIRVLGYSILEAYSGHPKIV